MTRILYDAKAAAAGCVISRLLSCNPPVTNKSRLSPRLMQAVETGIWFFVKQTVNLRPLDAIQRLQTNSLLYEIGHGTTCFQRQVFLKRRGRDSVPLN